MTPVRMTAHNLILLGGAALSGGRFDEAITHYREATRIEPNNPAAHSGLGCAFAYGGQRCQAEMPLRRALRLDPRCAAALRCLASLLVGDGKYGHALPILTRYAAVAGDKFEAHFNLGVACRQVGNEGDAVSALERAVALNPTQAVAIAHLGLAFKETGRHAQACATLVRAVALLPDRADLWCALGEGYNHLDLNDRAAAAFAEALRLDEGLAAAFHGLGTAHFNGGQYARAGAAFKAAVTLAPAIIDYWCDHGLAHLAAGDYQSAAATFAVACDRQPRHAAARRGAAAAHLGLGDGDAAYQHLAAIAPAAANDPMVSYYFSILHFRAGRLREAVEACRQAIEAEPELYKAVAVLAHPDGGSALGVRGRRAAAELGSHNLRDLLAIIKRANDDRQWRPRVIAGRRAG